jgi:hypothetical protein
VDEAVGDTADDEDPCKPNLNGGYGSELQQ